MKAKLNKTKNGFSISLTNLTEGKVRAIARALAIYSHHSSVCEDVRCSLEYAVMKVDSSLCDSFHVDAPKEA